MKRPALVRRRTVWLPTVWGWLTLLLVAAACAVYAARNVYAFLATTEPVGARTLIVEGWLPPEELDQAIATFRERGYERIVTTGGPISNEFERFGAASYAERARTYLVHNGAADETVIAVAAPASAQDRSFLSAVMVREWLAHAGETIDALDVFSSGVHSRRSRELYRMAFGPNVRVGIYAAAPSRPWPEAWWRTSVGVKEVPPEALAWLWTTLFFHPPKAGSHEEMWGIVPSS
jgi:hypothetical protein